jgi:hypothetical protein
VQKAARPVIRRLAALIFLTLFLTGSVSCSSKKPAASSEPSGYRDFLGDFAYDLPAACMVWEPVEGETDENGNPLYGLQYREIKDLDKLLAATDVKFLLYFHSSVYGDNAGITALVEEIAERLNGRVAVISLDAGEFNDLVGKYQITLLPEFVLCGYGMEAKVFGTADRGSWTMQEVVDWLAENGYSLSGG